MCLGKASFPLMGRRGWLEQMMGTKFPAEKTQNPGRGNRRKKGKGGG